MRWPTSADSSAAASPADASDRRSGPALRPSADEAASSADAGRRRPRCSGSARRPVAGATTSPVGAGVVTTASTSALAATSWGRARGPAARRQSSEGAVQHVSDCHPAIVTRFQRADDPVADSRIIERRAGGAAYCGIERSGDLARGIDQFVSTPMLNGDPAHRMPARDGRAESSPALPAELLHALQRQPRRRALIHRTTASFSAARLRRSDRRRVAGLPLLGRRGASPGPARRHRLSLPRRSTRSPSTRTAPR